MAIEIKVPRLGWNMEQGTFLGWLKRDGEVVRVGDALFTLEGDKAAQDVEATDSGILRLVANGPKENDTVEVGAVLGHLLAADEADAPAEQPTSPPQPPAGPAVRRKARQAGVDLTQVQGSGRAGRILETDIPAYPPTAVAPPVRARQAITPRARRAAASLDVDTTRVSGSGRAGRIRERDVLAFAASRPQPTRSSAAPSPRRRVIAERMMHSLRNTAPVTLTTTADATNLVALRRQFQAAASSREMLVPTYTDFIVKLTALTLQSHEVLNSTWDGDRLVSSPQVHVGIAVDTAAGLLVPVLRRVETLPVREVARQSRDLVEKARVGQLTAEQMQGGTFTVSNLGTLGVDAFTPIINWPQTAILGVGRICPQPAVVDNQVVPRDRVTLSLTFDHRATDGAPAARFLQALAGAIENPAAWLVG